MAIVEETIGDYFLRLSASVKPKPVDILMFDVTVTIHHYENTREPVRRGSTVIKTSVPVRCFTLFGNENLVLSFLDNPRYSDYFLVEELNQISDRIVYYIQHLLMMCPDDPEYESLVAQQLPVTVELSMDVMEDEDSGEESEEDEIERAIEESMQQEPIMTPASDEAILSLKTFTDTDSLKTVKECNICLEKFDVEEGDEDVKLSSMPCDHVFHHHCIVKWLQNSHTCPLCRYPMPTKD